MPHTITIAFDDERMIVSKEMVSVLAACVMLTMILWWLSTHLCFGGEADKQLIRPLHAPPPRRPAGFSRGDAFVLDRARHAGVLPEVDASSAALEAALLRSVGSLEIPTRRATTSGHAGYLSARDARLPRDSMLDTTRYDPLDRLLDTTRYDPLDTLLGSSCGWGGAYERSVGGGVAFWDPRSPAATEASVYYSLDLSPPPQPPQRMPLTPHPVIAAAETSATSGGRGSCRLASSDGL
jgi:hypothetical protein